MANNLPKDCKWIIEGDFNMTERPGDKSKDYDRAISDVERLSWNELLTTCQVHDTFSHQRGPWYSWSNGQYDLAWGLARLDRIYTPQNNGNSGRYMPYFIHAYLVVSNHALDQLTLSMDNEAPKTSPFKWNVSHLTWDVIDQLRVRWDRLPDEGSFFL